jgi:type II secretory pathway pseudopilin PulG
MQGFTLIETLVYIALFTFLMSSAGVAVTSIRATASRNASSALLLEEGMFLLEIVDRAAASGEDLSSFKIRGTTLVRADDPISGNQVRIHGLSIRSHSSAAGTPDYADIAFVLETNTDRGIRITHDFSERSYITSQ